MSSIRKLERTERIAYEDMVHAQAELVAARAQLTGESLITGVVNEDLDEERLGRLIRRAGAYRARWSAMSRRLEEALVRENADGYER